LNYLKEVHDRKITKLDLLDIEEPSEEFVNLTFEVMPKVSNNQTINFCDPPSAVPKGPPRILQMKGSLVGIAKKKV